MERNALFSMVTAYSVKFHNCVVVAAEAGERAARMAKPVVYRMIEYLDMGRRQSST